MFGLDLSEFALIGIVALLFIGPKDMPVAIRTVTGLIKKGRKLASDFQGHVDEMIKEADLGEARDQFRQLRSLNVRSQLMKALDSDGTIQKTLAENPIQSAIAGSSTPRFVYSADNAPNPLLAGGEPSARMASSRIQGSGMAGETIGTRPMHGLPLTDLAPEPTDAERAAREAADPAPSILPPAVAGRLRVERARPAAPRFVPPGAGGQRAVPVRPRRVPPAGVAS